MEFSKPKRQATSVYLNGMQEQTINILALANGNSKSSQIAKLVERIQQQEINKATDVIVNRLFVDWQANCKTIAWPQFKKNVGNLLYAKQIDKVNTNLIIAKLQEQYEAHNNG